MLTTKNQKAILLLGSLFLLSVAAPGQSADSQPRSGVPLRASSPAEVLFDSQEGAALWARGTSYKAKFDSAGSSYIPAVRSACPSLSRERKMCREFPGLHGSVRFTPGERPR